METVPLVAFVNLVVVALILKGLARRIIHRINNPIQIGPIEDGMYFFKVTIVPNQSTIWIKVLYLRLGSTACFFLAAFYMAVNHVPFWFGEPGVSLAIGLFTAFLCAAVGCLNLLKTRDLLGYSRAISSRG